MTIREATEDDVPTLVAMAERFIRSSAYRDRLEDMEHFPTLVEMIRTEGRIFVAATPDDVVVGMVAGLLFDHPFLHVSMGGNVLWWVEPDYRHSGTGAALFAATEDWARASGAEKMQFSSLRDRGIERLYGLYGYTEMEVVFEKDLS